MSGPGSWLDDLRCLINRPRLKAIDLGREWADGAPRLTFVCAACGRTCNGRHR